MFDLKAIRKDPDWFDTGWTRRGLPAQTPEILDLDRQWREVQGKLQDLQHERKVKSKEIGQIKAQGGDAGPLMEEVASMKDRMSGLEEQERTLQESLNQHLSALPNIMDPDVPDGEDDSDNVTIHTFGEPERANDASDHAEIGEALGMMDFETAAKMSGARFVLMHSGLARLERALAQLMLDTHTQENGYTEVSPPLLVRDKALFGTGQLPKFAEDQFRTTGDHWLIPTAEVSLTNIAADAIWDAGDLPMRFTAFTPCFRQEAGSAGKDTRGMIRQHQFYKVELVSVVHPDKSVEEHERMTSCAEGILKKLGLSFRRVVLCSGDTGFSARKTYDLEVWLPAQQTYREISSCSNCGDFQARRMGARFREEGAKETRFLHTLNGSGLAVGRALIAVLENYYDPMDQVLHIPEALKPYMGGKDTITRDDAAQGGKLATAG